MPENSDEADDCPPFDRLTVETRREVDHGNGTGSKHADAKDEELCQMFNLDPKQIQESGQSINRHQLTLLKAYTAGLTLPTSRYNTRIVRHRTTKVP